MYEKFFKRAADLVLSAAGLLMLAWLFLLIAVAIVVDDPGTVFFTQKRIGKDR